MSRKHHGKLSVIEPLLVLVLLSVLAGSGYYVWQATKTAEDDLTKTELRAPEPAPAKPESTPTDETAQWLLYTNPGKDFTVRLADGWQMTRYQRSDFIYARGADNVQYDEGTTATVTEVDGGSDGTAEGVFISYGTVSTAVEPQGTKQKSLLTKDGLEVTKYYYRESGNEEAGVGGLPGGGKQYTYEVSDGRQSVVISYGFAAQDDDQSEIVEQVARSVHFL